MRPMVRLGALALAGSALAGCSQITITSDTIVDGTARIADATTNAVQGTSNITTDTASDVDARTHAARRKFVDSQYAMLKREAAQGQGENLDALAYMMHAENTQAFDQKVQANYESLFSSDADADQWLTRLYQVVGTPPDMKMASAGAAG
ncbi:DUF3015 family protein [Salinisphaera aquimarina]|uniref:DUF3015 family protein n=1 Tax=Salinisphaera aquimarina TaxID=2094031 RepID=A0ABV7EV85_9GAMM